MRVTLVDNLVLPEQRKLSLLDTHPHLGLLSLAAVATAAGHDVSIYDPKRLVRDGDLPYDETLYELVAEQLLREKPEAIGFTTLGCSFLFVIGVGRELERRAPDLPQLLGGPHATMLATPILERYSPFDVIVRHEAEETFPEVLARLKRMDFVDVPGVSWRTSTGVVETPGSPRIDDLDSLPWLDYDLYPVRELGLDLMRVEAGRGCPFACTFCSTATFFQRRYRLKSPGRLVAEMNALRDRYAPKEFKLDHDLFTVNRGKVAEFCDEVAPYRHKWRVSARADCVDEALLEHMAEAGCVGLYLGIETGSPRMQKLCAKRLDLDRVAPTLDACARLGIETTASFITGYPEENRTDQDATLDMLGTCFTRSAATCIPQLHILTPEPGTLLFDQLGDQLEFDGYATPFNSWLLRPDDHDEVVREPEIFASYHYYPATIDRSKHVAVVETVDLLRQLGRPLCAALIRRHQRGLVGLVRALIDTRRNRLPDLHDLVEYVRHLLGDGDPITSAVRYAHFVSEPLAPEGAPHAGAPLADKVHGYLRLPANARILHDVHDCTKVMAWLDAGSDAAPADFARVSYVRLPGRTMPLRVEPSVVMLLHLFGRGRSASDVVDLLGATAQAQPDRWLPNLVDEGLLVSVDGTPQTDG